MTKICSASRIAGADLTRSTCPRRPFSWPVSRGAVCITSYCAEIVSKPRKMSTLPLRRSDLGQLTFRTVTQYRLDQLTFFENGLSRAVERPFSRKLMPRRNRSSPTGSISRPVYTHLHPMPRAARQQPTARRPAIRRNPRPALAVSTAQINLLSLEMASGAPPRRHFQ